MAPNLHEEVWLSWNAPEFVRFHRSPLWYVVAYSLLIGVGVSAWMFGNWSLSVVCVAIALWFATGARRAPRVFNVSITDKGMHLGEKVLSYGEIKSFAMVDGTPFFNELHLWTTDRWNPERHVLLMNVNPMLVQQILQTKVSERTGEKPKIADLLVRMLKLV